MVQADRKMKLPDEVRTLKSLSEVPINFRMPGVEVCPQYDWLVLGITYHCAVTAEWLNRKTTWSTWERFEADGAALSVIALAGFPTLRKLKQGCGYPKDWLPYQVICSWIEDDRYIRSINTRMAYLHPAYERNAGISGPLLCEIGEEMNVPYPQIEDTEHMVVYAAMAVAQSGLQPTMLKANYFTFYPASNVPPDLGAELEKTASAAQQENVKKLKRVQFVPPELFWSNGAHLKLVAEDCGIPLVMPDTPAGVHKAYEKICEAAARAEFCMKSKPPLLPDPKLDTPVSPDIPFDRMARTRRRERIMSTLTKLTGSLPHCSP